MKTQRSLLKLKTQMESTLTDKDKKESTQYKDTKESSLNEEIKLKDLL